MKNKISYWLVHSALFGLKMLKEGFEMRADEGMEELEEVQQELKQKDEERERVNRKAFKNMNWRKIWRTKKHWPWKSWNLTSKGLNC